MTAPSSWVVSILSVEIDHKVTDGTFVAKG